MRLWWRSALPMAGAVASAVALAGCTAAAPTTAPAGAPTDAPAEPKVDRLVMAVEPLSGEETNDLRNMSSPTVWPYRSVYEYPIALDVKTGKLTPGLATEWKLEPDGQSYRVKLRPNVPYHDSARWGNLVAQDAVYMWQDITRTDSVHGQTRYWREAVKDVEVVNDLEVIYHLTKPDGQFITALSETQGGAEIRSSKKALAEGNPVTLDQAHAGTGPYKFKARETGARIVLERSEHKHWTGVTPAFREFEFRFIREPSTRVAALVTNEVHIADIPDDLKSQALQRGMAIRKAVFPGVRVFGQIYCCYFDKEPWQPDSKWRNPDAPLMDIRLRKALNVAINRDELNKAFFGGKGELMYVNHFHPSRDGWDPSWERRFKDEYGYDPAKARSLLAEAGYGPGKQYKITMLVVPITGVAGGPDIAEAIAGYWRAVGIDVELANVDPAELARRSRGYEYTNHVRLFGTGSNQWTGTSVLSGSYSQGGGARDIEVEAGLAELTRTLDEQKRNEIWRRVGEALFKNHNNINLFWLPAEAVVNPQIVGDWLFPGSITGTWTHIHNIKAAR